MIKCVNQGLCPASNGYASHWPVYAQHQRFGGLKAALMLGWHGSPTLVQESCSYMYTTSFVSFIATRYSSTRLASKSSSLAHLRETSEWFHQLARFHDFPVVAWFPDDRVSRCTAPTYRQKELHARDGYSFSSRYKRLHVCVVTALIIKIPYSWKSCMICRCQKRIPSVRLLWNM